MASAAVLKDVNRRFFIGFFTGALAALATPFGSWVRPARHPDLVTRKVFIFRERLEGDFTIWRGIGGLHPFKDARPGDIVKIVSDPGDPADGKLFRVVEGPVPTDNLYREGDYHLTVEDHFELSTMCACT